MKRTIPPQGGYTPGSTRRGEETVSILKSGLWTVLLGVFVNTAAQAYLYATLPSVGRSIGLVETQTGLILGGGGLLGMLTAPAWGYLSERWGRRPVLVLAMSAVGVSPLVLALMLGGVAAALAAISVFLVVLGARSIQAAFGSALIPVSQAYIADITPSSDRTGGMGLLGAAISVGTIGGSALVWVIGGMSSVAGFALIAASAVLAFLLALVFLPEPERHVAKERDASTVPFRKLWPYFTITAFAMTAYSIVQPVMGLRLMDQLGLSQPEAIGLAGAAVTCTAVAMVIAQAILTPLLRWSPSVMVQAGGVGAVLGLVVVALGTDIVVILSAMTWLGLSLGLVLPGNLAAVSLATGSGAQGKVAGLNTVALGIGLAVGPIVGTAIYGVSYTAPFWLAAVLAFGVAAFAFVASQRRGSEAMPAKV